ncbi:MAG: hypothetical protein WDO73_08725 [Ignavibacteriota bacterium]
MAPIPSSRSNDELWRFHAANSGASTMERLSLGMNSVAHTRRSGFGYASGRRKMEFTTLKMSALAPIPSASVTSAAAVNPGLRRKRRKAWRSSWKDLSIQI